MIRESAQRAINLLQHSSEVFLQNGFVRDQNCTSCHHQCASRPRICARTVTAGLQVDDAALGHQIEAQISFWSTRTESARELEHPAFGLFQGLTALDALRYSPDNVTAAIVRYVRDTQCNNGSWREGSGRPPIEESSWAEVPWAIRALKSFPIEGEEKSTQQTVRRAVNWLRREKPATLNERGCQLLALGWAGESPQRLQPLARALLKDQRPDGGWSQLPTLESDAWATGQTLYVLHEAGGLSTTDPAYQRGVEFLLRTQFEDGSWWVRNRTWPFQPHFNSQFPHGKDQWISAGGTAWATMAILSTIEPVKSRESFPTGQQLVATWTTTQKSKMDHDVAAPHPSPGRP